MDHGLSSGFTWEFQLSKPHLHKGRIQSCTLPEDFLHGCSVQLGQVDRHHHNFKIIRLRLVALIGGGFRILLIHPSCSHHLYVLALFNQFLIDDVKMIHQKSTLKWNVKMDVLKVKTNDMEANDVEIVGPK